MCIHSISTIRFNPISYQLRLVITLNLDYKQSRFEDCILKQRKIRYFACYFFVFRRNENKYLLGNYRVIFTFTFYYFWEREREILENTGRNKEIGEKLWRKYCHESCDIRSPWGWRRIFKCQWGSARWHILTGGNIIRIPCLRASTAENRDRGTRDERETGEREKREKYGREGGNLVSRKKRNSG